MDELNQVCGIDKNGNNLDGYHKTGNHKKDGWDFGIERRWNQSIYNTASEYSKQILKDYLHE